MSSLYTYQFCLHDGTYQFGIGTIDDQKNSLFQERFLQIRCCFFQRQQTFLTCHIGKFYDLADHLGSIQCRCLEDQSKGLQTRYVIL